MRLYKITDIKCLQCRYNGRWWDIVAMDHNTDTLRIWDGENYGEIKLSTAHIEVMDEGIDIGE